MNQLANEQRLQIIEYYYQNSCSVKRVHSAIIPLKIVFSDEAYFWLNSYVSKQNCHIWCNEQPEAFQELPMHHDKCTVWCGLWAGKRLDEVLKNDTPIWNTKRHHYPKLLDVDKHITLTYS